jgi:hypothetical protein
VKPKGTIELHTCMLVEEVERERKVREGKRE